MSRIWKKIRGRWQSYWQDDGDDPGMIHLSRQDKRSLLYGGFMVSMVTLFLLLAAVTVSNCRADRENAESLEKVLDMVNAYLATATEDEYEDVAETIRHDLVYSQYGEDIESLIQYIPNTADSCCLDREKFLSRINFVFLNTGEAYDLDILEAEDQTGEKSGGIQLTCGYDEISESSIRITEEGGEASGTAVLSRGRGIVSIHKMKGKFCDTCMQKILETVKEEAVGEAVIYDTVDKRFYPIAEGERQIGDYVFQTAYEQGKYEIQIEYVR